MAAALARASAAGAAAARLSLAEMMALGFRGLPPEASSATASRVDRRACADGYENPRFVDFC